jgi:hypothetical protein
MLKNGIFYPKKAHFGQFLGKIARFHQNEKGISDYSDIPFLLIFINLFFHSFNVLAGFCVHPYQLSFINK